MSECISCAYLPSSGLMHSVVSDFCCTQDIHDTASTFALVPSLGNWSTRRLLQCILSVLLYISLDLMMLTPAHQSFRT